MILYRKGRTVRAVLMCLAGTCLICGAAYFLRRAAAGWDAELSGCMPSEAGREEESGSGQVSVGDGGVYAVVLDAGHGGADGGAQSADGLSEKDVNLSVSLYLRDLLEAAGVPVVMTRTDDRMLYDTPSPPLRGRKSADLNARLHMAQTVPDSLFVSIHMNAYPQASVKGLQVWYAPADPRSAGYAEAVQSRAFLLQPDNTRRVKAAGSSIFLLDRLRTPGILVEGGFMSNPGEAALLSDDDYRRALAFTVFLGIMSGAEAGT